MDKINTKNKITILNGPNLNLLGQRDKSIYGSRTLEEIVSSLKEKATNLGLELIDYQSNVEGELINYLQQADKDSIGVIFNPGGYSHTSVAIRDAIDAITVPVIEVHLSNIYAREEYRKHSYVSEVAKGVISGFGEKGYFLALDVIISQE